MGFSTKQLQELGNAKLFELSVKEPEKAKTVIVAVKSDEETEIVFGGAVYDLSLNAIAIVDKYLEVFSEKTGVGYSEGAEMFAAVIKAMGKGFEEVGKNGIQ